MAKYLFQVSYTAGGAEGLRKEGGVGRRAAFADLMKSAGGSLESFYYAFGETDAYIIADLPDNEAATAVALTADSAGAVAMKTTVLIDPETVDAAVKRTVNYRPPGA